MTEPTSPAWWVDDRPGSSGSFVDEAASGGAASGGRPVAMTTRLPETDGPPDLVLIQAPAASRPGLRPAARPPRRPTGRPSVRIGAPRGGALLAVVAVAAVLLIVLASWALVHALHPGRSDGPGPNAGTGASRAVLPVDPAGVVASASSTQKGDGGISYSAANTLDGDPTTAWNSDGGHDGRGPGITLTYTFPAPVELRSVSVLNGYQKFRPRPGKTPVDLYAENERLRQVRVVTDAGSWTWDLADSRDRQTLTTLTGTTRTLRLEVVSVYASTAYPDLALSEVAFTAATR